MRTWFELRALTGGRIGSIDAFLTASKEGKVGSFLRSKGISPLSTEEDEGEEELAAPDDDDDPPPEPSKPLERTKKPKKKKATAMRSSHRNPVVEAAADRAYLETVRLERDGRKAAEAEMLRSYREGAVDPHAFGINGHRSVDTMSEADRVCMMHGFKSEAHMRALSACNGHAPAPVDVDFVLKSGVEPTKGMLDRARAEASAAKAACFHGGKGWGHQ